MEVRIRTADLVIAGPNTSVQTMPEDQFFSRRDSGVDNTGYVPLPAGVDFWYDGTYKGESVMISAGGPDLYLIVDDANSGLSLYHYVYPDADHSWARQSFDFPRRVLTNERSITKMAGMIPMDLGAIAAQSGNNRVPTTPLEGNSGMNPTGDGVAYGPRGAAASPTAIAQIAQKKGYVAGYIMGAAPAISLALSKSSPKNQATTYSIVAKESKPSRPIAVAMALPARCVMKGGTMATPTEIQNGQVDFNTISEEEMVYQTFAYQAAIAYISKLGQKLPEYAPNVTNANRHWSPDQILYGDPNVSFVVVKATANKSATASNESRYRFNLKTTSPRNSLYTRNNHVCLRALRHMPVTCQNEKDAWRLNESAFGRWRFHTPPTSNITTLQNAINNCPSQIWMQNYNIDGKEVEGIGSAFFMAGPAVERTIMVDGKEEKKQIVRQQLEYQPWWATGSLRGAPVKLESMVERTLRPAEGDKKARMITQAVTYKDAPDDPMFKPYQKFIKFLIDGHYIRPEALKEMGGRATRTNPKMQPLSGEQMSSLDDYMERDDVRAAIQSAQNEASTRAALTGKL